jgi:hypothetical protein
MVQGVVRSRAGGQAGTLVASSGDADVVVSPQRGETAVLAKGGVRRAARSRHRVELEDLTLLLDVAQASRPVTSQSAALAGPESSPSPQPSAAVTHPASLTAEGLARQSQTLQHKLTTTRRSFPSVILSGVVLTRGRWYYEVTVTEAGLAQVGWCDVSFVGSSAAGVGVGDDKSSIAYDGYRQKSWFHGARAWGSKWSAGDVIGCAVDVDAGHVAFSLNGDFSHPMGMAATGHRFVGGAIPGLTIQHGVPRFSGVVNLGEDGYRSFRHSPPMLCLPVAAWIAGMGLGELHRGLPSSLAPLRSAVAAWTDRISAQSHKAPPSGWSVMDGLVPEPDRPASLTVTGAVVAEGTLHSDLRSVASSVDGALLPVSLDPRLHSRDASPAADGLAPCSVGLLTLSGRPLVFDTATVLPVAGYMHKVHRYVAEAAEAALATEEGLEAAGAGSSAAALPIAAPTSHAAEFEAPDAVRALRITASTGEPARAADGRLRSVVTREQLVRAVRPDRSILGAGTGLASFAVCSRHPAALARRPVSDADARAAVAQWSMRVRCVSAGPCALGFASSADALSGCSWAESRGIGELSSDPERHAIALVVGRNSHWQAERDVFASGELDDMGLSALGADTAKALGVAALGFPTEAARTSCHGQLLHGRLRELYRAEPRLLQAGSETEWTVRAGGAVLATAGSLPEGAAAEREAGIKMGHEGLDWAGGACLSVELTAIPVDDASGGRVPVQWRLVCRQHVTRSGPESTTPVLVVPDVLRVAPKSLPAELSVADAQAAIMPVVSIWPTCLLSVETGTT